MVKYSLKALAIFSVEVMLDPLTFCSVLSLRDRPNKSLLTLIDLSPFT